MTKSGTAVRAAAASLAALSLIFLAGCTGTTTGPPTPTPASATSATHSAVPAPTATPAACTSGQLSGHVKGSGDALGTQITFILFTNVSTVPCWFGGTPRLIGVTASGTTTALPFRPDAYRDTRNGPGILWPRKTGIVKATMQLNNCTYPANRFDAYTTLRLEFSGDSIVTLPFPKAFTVTGCAGQVGQAALGAD